jgi:hypothetical protein
MEDWGCGIFLKMKIRKFGSKNRLQDFPPIAIGGNNSVAKHQVV